MFEIAGADEEVSRRALKLASYKLPIRCKVVSREELDKILADREAGYAEKAAAKAAAKAE
jgi:ribosomal protein L16/L10AE